MFASLRRSYSQFITSGGQLLLLFAGFHLGSRDGWLWCLGGMAAISLIAWYSTLRRLRIIGGTPTSRIASAAQGYVELMGRALPHDIPLVGKYSLLPCLWYRYRVERKNYKNEWRTETSGESEAPFVIDDGSGQCVIAPGGAEIFTRHKRSWQVGDHRYTEWMLLPQDALYALGEFKTVGGSSTELTHNELVNRVLAEWKQDHKNLLAQFDLNNDGELDMREWMLARQAAKREAHKRLAEARAEADTHFLLPPSDGRLFLISNLPPEKLAGLYKLWSWLHVTIFFGALIGMARVLA